MTITSTCHTQDIPQIAAAIHKITKESTVLTTRSINSVSKLLATKSVVLALDDDSLVVGFICTRPLGKTWLEIFGWYINPDYRRQHIGEQLLKSVVSNSHFTYLGTTFQPAIITIAEKYGFHCTTFNALPPLVLMQYVLTRDLHSIFHHFRSERSTLLCKTPT